jgi:NAD+ synthase (glutamine-hydrolysing)
MVQMNPIVGDLDGNASRIIAWIREARKAKADLVAFPELAITGYPPEDLLLKTRFIEDNRRALQKVAKQVSGITAVVGYVEHGGSPAQRFTSPGVLPAGRHELYNAAAIIADGCVISTYYKWHLPNYGVFDESRYFHSGKRLPLVMLHGVAVGVNICEDIWLPEGPTRAQAAAGAEIVVNINASPFHMGKSRYREHLLATRARENGVMVTYTNMVGGQDELVFDGNSLILDQTGEVTTRGKAFEEDMIVADLDAEPVARHRMRHSGKKSLAPDIARLIERITVKSAPSRPKRTRSIPAHVSQLEPLEEVYRALTLGIRDYVRKNGFKHVVIGLSGGIDSALTIVLAVDALGAGNVLAVFMPSPYTSRESREDVADLVRRVGIKLLTIPITRTFRSYLSALEKSFHGTRPDVTEENVQARIRGNLLMALSNKFGHLVLTTGNKSEMSVGYATLYGDMAGGFAVIKDVPKTMVYELAHLRNRMGDSPVIPKRVLERAPTAELKPNQRDEDSLPSYAVLDPILKAYVEDDQSVEDIVKAGFDRNVVARVVRLVDQSEYKRRQAPIGIKITHRALGKDRRMPITNGYRHS